MDLKDYRLVDLTHSLHEGVPSWSGRCGFRLETRLDYDQGLRVQTVKSHAGVGTHIDAPSHFVRGGANVGDIELKNLFVPVCVLNLKHKMDPDFFVEREDIEHYEKQYGPLPKNALVIASTGWEQFWHDPSRYRNPDLNGNMHFQDFQKRLLSFFSKKQLQESALIRFLPMDRIRINFLSTWPFLERANTYSKISLTSTAFQRRAPMPFVFLLRFEMLRNRACQ